MAIPEKPISRIEHYLARANGQNVTPPEPISRIEHYLNGIAGGVPQELLDDVADLKSQMSEKAPAIMQTVTDQAIASFSDGANDMPLKSLVVDINPVQAGTGDPSPENVRPITGWNAVTVTVNGTEYTTDLGQTVYGGTLDMVTGELTVTMAAVDLETLNWSYYNPAFYANLPNKVSTPPGDSIRMICSIYKVIKGQNSMNISEDKTICEYIGGSSPYLRICVRDDSFNGDITAFKNEMSGETLVYELANPQTYQLTPVEVKTLLGQNNIFADTGNVTVIYPADTKMYIDGQIATLQALVLENISNS